MSGFCLDVHSKGVHCSYCGWAGSENGLSSSPWTQLCPNCKMDGGLSAIPEDEVWFVDKGKVVYKIVNCGRPERHECLFGKFECS